MMKILLVGVSVRAMAESAVHSGYRAVALDAFGDRDLKVLAESYSLRYDFRARYSARALYDASRQLAFDSVAYTSNLENHPEILYGFAARHPIIGNSPQVVGSVRRWATLFAKLRQVGFSVPEVILPDGSREADPGRRWLIKPVLSGGGHGIAFLNNEEALSSHPFIIQEYVPGKPCSAAFVANGHDSVVIGITEQLIGLHQLGAQGFRYCGNVLPLPEAFVPDTGNIVLEEVRRLAATLTREYALTGVNGIDFILSGRQVFMTEINPRYSASMELVEMAYGLPVFELHMQAVLDGKLPKFNLDTVLKNGNYFGKGILYADRDAVAPDTKNWMGKAIRDIPASGETLSKGGPVCTILVSQSTYGDTLNELISQAAMLKEAIYG